jgi:hypothetical protein
MPLHGVRFFDHTGGREENTGKPTQTLDGCRAVPEDGAAAMLPLTGCPLAEDIAMSVQADRLSAVLTHATEIVAHDAAEAPGDIHQGKIGCWQLATGG